jgi:DNA-binding CsgD family transcriptional regulator
MLAGIAAGCSGGKRARGGRHVELASLNKIGARLGELVLDPAGWVGVMDDICAGIGARGAGLLQADVRTPDIPRTSGVQEAFDAYFKQGWHLRDVRAKGAALLLQGRKVFTDEDICTPEEIRRDPFYNECIFPAGLRGFAGIGVFAESRLWAVAIQRAANEGPFEQDELRALAGLASGLTAAATLSVIVGRAALSSAIDALSLIHQPALVLDRHGAVIGINRAAENIFDDDLRVRGRRVHVHDKLAAAALDALIDRMTLSADLAPAEPITIRRRLSRPIIARVHPVPDAARSPFLGARALMILSSLAPRPPLSTTLLAGTFGLSRAEAKLASILAGGMDLRTAAEELGVARDTARNQLKAIFAKTGAHRQSELVELLAKLQI